MRLVSFSDNDRETLGVERGGKVVRVRDIAPSAPDTLAGLIAAGPVALADLDQAVQAGSFDAATAIEDLELLASVPHAPNIIAIGRNYREHAEEEGKDAPPAPEIFL